MTDETTTQDETATFEVEQLDPAKVSETLHSLVVLDHQLRDHGVSLAELLTDLARTRHGIRLD